MWPSGDGGPLIVVRWRTLDNSPVMAVDQWLDDDIVSMVVHHDF